MNKSIDNKQIISIHEDRSIEDIGLEHYSFKLFVVGAEANSELARKNLLEICKKYLANRHEIEIIDVLCDFQAALDENVLFSPTLILKHPTPKVIIVGNLSNRPIVLRALRLDE